MQNHLMIEIIEFFFKIQKLTIWNMGNLNF